MAETPQVQIESPLPRKPGRSLLVTGIALVVLLVAGFGWYYYYGPCGLVRVRNAADEMQSLTAEWKDALELAGATPRMTLGGPLSDLQAIRRNVQNVEVPSCMGQIKQDLTTSMDLAIDGFLAFAGQEEDTIVGSYFSSANIAMDRVTDGLRDIQDCTPFCPTSNGK